MALADLNVRLGLVTKSFDQSLNNVDRQLRKFQRSVEGVGRDLTNSITIPLAGLGAASIASFAEFEKGAKALEAVTKDAKSVSEQLADLREVAKLPGLGFQEAVQGSARLQAVGLSADEAARTLAEFGNAVARSGGGRVELEGALLALTQIASKGKISAEEINQLNERIFEIRPALEAAFGTSNSEELQKLGISSEEFISKVTNEFAKLERVQGGLANSFENFGDSVRTNLSRVGEIINKSFNVGDIITRFDNALTKVVDTFANLDDSTQRTIVRVAAFAVATGPALLGIGKIISLGSSAIVALKLLTSGFASLAGGLINVANSVSKLNFAALLTPQLLALTAAVGAAILIWKEFSRRVELANAAQNAVKKVSDEAAAAVVTETGKVKTLIGIIKEETTSKEAKARAVRQLKEINPEYFGQLDEENIKISDLDKGYQNLTKSVLLRAKLAAANDQITDIARRELAIQREITKIREDAAKAEGAFADAFISVSERKLKRRNQELESIQKEKNAIADLAASAQKDLLTFELEVTAPEKTTKKIIDGFDRINLSAQKIPEAIQDIRASLNAIDTKKSFLGDSFNEDRERLDILEKGIEKLIEVGAGQENEFLNALSGQLEELKRKQTKIQLSTDFLDTGINKRKDIELGEAKVKIKGISEAEIALFAYENQLKAASNQAQIFGITAGDLLNEKINITRNAIQGAIQAFGGNSEAVALLREQYLLLNEQLDISNEKQIRQQESLLAANAIAGTISAGMTEFFTALEQGSKNAFQSFTDGFKKAIAELLKRLAIALVQALAVAAVLSIIFPGSAAAAGGFGKVFSGAFKKGIGLAEGGIVPPGFPNDTFPARLSSNEVVIPLEKLSTLPGVGGNTQVIIPNLIIRGQDFVIAFEQAKNAYNRYS